MMQNRLIQQKLFYNDDAPFKAAVTQSPVASTFHSCDIAQENYPGRYLSKVNWEKSDLDRLLHAPDHAALGESWSIPCPNNMNSMYTTTARSCKMSRAESPIS